LKGMRILVEVDKSQDCQERRQRGYPKTPDLDDQSDGDTLPDYCLMV
jgi:hypothetical protein